jgi:hypothetical protein
VAAQRAWIVDQSAGIDPIGAYIARAGFSAITEGTP